MVGSKCHGRAGDLSSHVACDFTRRSFTTRVILRDVALNLAIDLVANRITRPG
jgi:hypothetical protein